MSNSYGFDFLRSEHKDLDGEDDGDGDEDNYNNDVNNSVPRIATDTYLANKNAIDVRNKPDLEKQFLILAFLQAHPGSGCLSPPIIYRATGIDLDVDVTVAAMLQTNPKIRVERVPDPENPSLTVATYAYQAKYSSVRDRTTLLAQINRMSSGVPMRDLSDSYPGVDDDLKMLITGGDVIAVYNSEDKDKILFPRGESFLVELDGLVVLPKHVSNAYDERESENTKYEEKKRKWIQDVERKGRKIQTNDQNRSIQEEEEGKRPGFENNVLMPPPPPKRNIAIPECYIVETDVDPRKQIRRGEAVCVGGQWFRVSSAVKAGIPLHEQPARAQAPLSVVSLEDMNKRNEIDGYIRPLSESQLSVDAALSENAIRNLSNAKNAREHLVKLSHGLTRSSGSAGSSGATSAAQLAGSHAHSSNPSTLAASFASSTINNFLLRKRSTNDAGNSNTVSEPILTKEALQKAASDINLALYSHARRHGCTRDVRQMYLQTRSYVPESDIDLQKVLIEHKLLEPNEQMRRPRLTKQGSNVDNDGKPKKRRYYERKNQRMTNTHLEGTYIGAILAQAAEKQKQGKSVGDGGM
jgi:TFA2 Winged helix domain 2